MRLAVLQMQARCGGIDANLRRIAIAAGEAAASGADLLVCPELAVTGYGAGAAIRNLSADDRQVAGLAEISERHGIGLVAGFAEADGQRIYNAALVALPGRAAAVYRKCHLYGDYERDLFHPGDRLAPLFDVAGAKVGVGICYDIEFPELARGLAVAGADLVMVPTALPESDNAAFIAGRVVPVRAFENQVFVAYANHCGTDDLFAYAGRSCIVAPDGTDLARAGPSGEALLISDIDPAAYGASRKANPYLVDRRPDLA